MRRMPSQDACQESRPANLHKRISQEIRDFNPLEFEGFRSQAGLNAFTLSPTQWIEATNSIGLITKAGRYGYEILTLFWEMRTPFGKQGSGHRKRGYVNE